VSRAPASPDWSIRIALTAGAMVIASFFAFAVYSSSTPPAPPDSPGMPYRIIAEGRSPATNLRRFHILVPAEATRAQLFRLRDYLDYRHRGELAVTFVFYDDETAAREQFAADFTPGDDWERHLVGQYLRGPQTRWFGRPSEGGFEKWE